MPVKRWETNMQRNEKHDKNLPHQPPWLGSGFGGPLWKATWLPVQVVQGGMHARAKDMTGPEYLLERALTKRFLRFAAFLAFLRLDFISFRNEVRSWVSFLISSWMTSWQQERTPKGGPDLGSISGTGTNGLDSTAGITEKTPNRVATLQTDLLTVCQMLCGLQSFRHMMILPPTLQSWFLRCLTETNFEVCKVSPFDALLTR